ncbi:hypothetical protein HPB51_029488 [Rhipicephalus microplus]|uniref:SWIM-type domain-containing protein n=1 Tax=Rhipicephalus microplus TaxID=6941 RepID=A0A9J6CUB6_RHIMP|nr:hypothetical protein HPB51_029488 [Rhipicephalus microplus]
MTSSEARRLHESKLSMEDEGPAKLANAALNPPQRTVYHWHSVWREACFGGTHIDPVLKLEEKASLYAAQGTHTSVTHGDSSACWAVFVVTPIMRRAHNLELAREIVFVDSTASCDTTKCTVTVVLTATKACAVPLAVLIHKEQSTDGYLAAFKLLKEAHPLCFGGQPVMYADTAEKLEAATAELKALQHEAFVSRVLTFLRRQEEWVQLDRLDVLTRGHNTNNFAEATIRVLKGIILNRVEAFNAAALVDSVALVWEKYFESRILRHAYNRVAAHQLLYKRLLSRMPKDPAEAIQVVGQGQYIVPSATHPSSSYEVYADIGLCTCLFGKQGAFCKHQALVQKKFGGLFANAPALSTDDRYQLGQLALGEKCPPPPGYFSNPSKRRSPAVVPEPRKVPVPSRRSQTNSNQCKAPARKRPHTLHLYHQCLMQPNLPRTPLVTTKFPAIMWSPPVATQGGSVATGGLGGYATGQSSNPLLFAMQVCVMLAIHALASASLGTVPHRQAACEPLWLDISADTPTQCGFNIDALACQAAPPREELWIRQPLVALSPSASPTAIKLEHPRVASCGLGGYATGQSSNPLLFAMQDERVPLTSCVVYPGPSLEQAYFLNLHMDNRKIFRVSNDEEGVTALMS